MKPKELPYSNKGDLTTGPVGGHLVRLTVPTIWGILAVISLHLVDTYFISMLGTRELAGISFTFPVTMIITHLVFGLNIAMSSVISRLIGQKKMDDARRVVLHGMIMAFIASFVIAILCFIFLDPLFHMLGIDDASMQVVRDYMPLWLLSSIFIAVQVNANSAMRAAGDSFLPAIIMLSMALVNLALAPTMIFGWLGFPAMGVQGAALATLIACFCAMLCGLYAVIFKRNLMAKDSLYLNEFRDSFGRLIVIALPAGITNIIQPATNAFIVALLAAHGPETVAAYGIATRIEAFALLFVMSLALGMAPIVGQNWGAENYARVHRAINLSIGFNIVWSTAVAILLGLFAHQIASAFSSDPAVIDAAVLFFWIVPISYAFSNLVYGWGSAFNAMGMPARAFVMIVVKSIVMLLPAVFIGGQLYGIIGIFIAISAVNFIAGIYFHITSWRACMAREHAEQQVPA